MALSNDLISQFIKVNESEKSREKESVVYGTAVDLDGKTWVKLDGSPEGLLTPIDSTTTANNGDRVMVQIKNHTATLTGNLTSKATNSGELDTERARISYLESDNVTINETLEAAEAEIKELSADNATIKDTLTAANADIENLKTDKLDASIAAITYAAIKDLEATNATVHNLDATFADFQVTTTNKLGAVDASIKNLDAEKLDAGVAEITYAKIADLKAIDADIDSLEADVANIGTLVFGSATGDIISTNFSNAVIAQLGDAQIKSAMIESVAASKITAGDIITNKVRVKSEDGSLLISDETMQISDDTRVRVQIGKDASGDYSINIWDQNGDLMFSKGGITDSAIKDAIIRNDMVSDTANIAAHKLDIDSLFEEINGSTNTIKSSQVYLDDVDQTLDLAFKTMETDISGLNDRITSHGTQITAVQGQITSKVWQQDINDAKGEMSTQYSTLEQELDGVSATVASHTSQIANKADSSTVTTVSEKVANLETGLNGFKSEVSSTYTTKSDVISLTNRITNAETSISQNSEAIALAATKTEVGTELYNNYYTKSQSDANLTAKADEITSSVKSVYATQSSLNDTNANVTLLGGDPTNYAKLNNSTASKWGFTVEDDAAGDWYIMNRTARDTTISPEYECFGGEKIQIDYEVVCDAKATKSNISLVQMNSTAIQTYYIETAGYIHIFLGSTKDNFYTHRYEVVAGQQYTIYGENVRWYAKGYPLAIFTTSDAIGNTNKGTVIVDGTNGDKAINYNLNFTPTSNGYIWINVHTSYNHLKVMENGPDVGYVPVNVGLYCKRDTGGHFIWPGVSAGTSSATGNVLKGSGVVTLSEEARKFQVNVQLSGWPVFTGSCKIRNVRVSKITAIENRIKSAESSITQMSDRITANVTAIDGVNTRVSTVQQTASDLTVRLNSAETNIAAAKKQKYHEADGTTASTGYVGFCTLTVTGGYVNVPITFNISNRGQQSSNVSFCLSSISGTDPTLSHIQSDGGINVWAYKSAESTWVLIAQKSEGYDVIYVNDYTKPRAGVTLSWSDIHYDTLPTGNITEATKLAGKLTKETVDNAAKTATNYLNFSNNGLVVGNHTASSLGKNVLIDSDSVDIRNGNTVLASFGASSVILGQNDANSVIDLCDGAGTIKALTSGASTSYPKYDSIEIASQELTTSSQRFVTDVTNSYGTTSTPAIQNDAEIYMLSNKTDAGSFARIAAACKTTSTGAEMKAGASAIVYDKYSTTHMQIYAYDSTDTLNRSNRVDVYPHKTVMDKPVFINGTEFTGDNKVLWSGGYYMSASQTATLSQAISDQANGVVLLWSYYVDGAPDNSNFHTCYIPKHFVSLHNGKGVSMLLSNASLSIAAGKYVYVSNTSISGYATNDDAATAGACGLTSTPKNFVLRYVIGV